MIHRILTPPTPSPPLRFFRLVNALLKQVVRLVGTLRCAGGGGREGGGGEGKGTLPTQPLPRSAATPRRYGFNAGSTLAIHNMEGVAAKTAVCTTLAAASGTIGSLVTGEGVGSGEGVGRVGGGFDTRLQGVGGGVTHANLMR